MRFTSWMCRRQICSNCVMLSCQYGPKSLRNVSNTLLNLCHEELRQFWRQKGVRPGTSKVIYYIYIYINNRRKIIKLFNLGWTIPLRASHFHMTKNTLWTSIQSCMLGNCLFCDHNSFCQVSGNSDIKWPMSSISVCFTSDRSGKQPQNVQVSISCPHASPNLNQHNASLNT